MLVKTRTESAGRRGGRSRRQRGAVLPWVMVAMALILFTFWSLFWTDLTSVRADELDVALILKSAFLELYGPKAGSLEIRTDGDVLWPVLPSGPDSPKASDFPNLRFGLDPWRDHFKVVKPGWQEDDNGNRIYIGTAPEHTPAARMRKYGRITIFILDPRYHLGYLNKEEMVGNTEPGRLTLGTLIRHELGHGCRARTIEESEVCAIENENAHRRDHNLLPERIVPGGKRAGD